MDTTPVQLSLKADKSYIDRTKLNEINFNFKLIFGMLKRIPIDGRQNLAFFSPHGW